MFFTREKNDPSNQKSQKCVSFALKPPAFYRRLQLEAPLNTPPGDSILYIYIYCFFFVVVSVVVVVFFF